MVVSDNEVAQKCWRQIYERKRTTRKLLKAAWDENKEQLS
jgi:hypothetical protein